MHPNASARPSFIALLAALLATLGLAACTTGNDNNGDDAGPVNPIVDGGFVCFTADSVACIGNTHYSCDPAGEFLSRVVDDCDARDDGRNLCLDELGCAFCRPNEVFCSGPDVATCNADGSAFEIAEECDVAGGFVCNLGECRNLCDIAVDERSYLGCEFYSVDLDNASLGIGQDASAQQYSVVVSNPSPLPSDVVVEINRAAPGEEPDVVVIDTITVLPGDLEIIDLPRREVDGASGFNPCDASSECLVGDQCYCAGGALREGEEPSGGFRDCRCRNAPDATGFDDGTHSALTSHAFRLSSVLPIIAYQFNPLDNVGVFSNDASLLLPTSALGETYTVVGWPQTIAHSDRPDQDFDPSRDDEGLRAFMTVVGTQAATHVTITFGSQVVRVLGIGERGNAVSGDVWEFDIGPYDVINIETDGFDADFTGTTVDADRPVSVFTGSEASDAPRFSTLSNRQCCADHLEEQLFPNDTLGRQFYIPRMPARSTTISDAITTGESVGEFSEPQWVRIVAVNEGVTTIDTSLPPPDDQVQLERYQSVILEAYQDFEITASNAVAVLQVLPSQGAVGLASHWPGGDPAIIAVPPAEQYRNEYVFLTPLLYAFDFVTITAERSTGILLDGTDIQSWIMDGQCEIADADGRIRRMDEPPAEWVVYRCQFSFPEVEVLGPRNVAVLEGDQNDGYHTIQASADVGLAVYGFDAFVSYAYAGGLNLDPLN